ncbi:MAG: hypothetical protein Q9220_003490 [cf. Caloplaca sp. 1 TL-2023]
MPSLYDTFLIQEPLRQDPFAVVNNPDDKATLIEVYNKSAAYYHERDRRRAVERLQYEVAVLYMQDEKWKKALGVLLPLWQSVSWRREGWWEMFWELGQQVRECARRCGDTQSVVRAEWEMMCNYGMDSQSSKPHVVVRAEEALSCLSGTFIFGATQGNVGEPLPAQLLISSHAQSDTAPLVLSHILISFEGGLKDILIEHSTEAQPVASATLENILLYDVTLGTGSLKSESSGLTSSTSSDSLVGLCDLKLLPGESKALALSLQPKESGNCQVTSITSTIQTESFTFDYIISNADDMRQDDHWFQTETGVGRRPASNNGSSEIRIHPKPPKMQIRLPELKKEYLTDETVLLDIEIINEESDDADLVLEARFLGQKDAIPTWAWITGQEQSTRAEDPLANDNGENMGRYHVGHVASLATQEIKATFQASSVPTEAVLEIKAFYHLSAEPDTPIPKALINDILFDRPFEANYDLRPSVDTRLWPSYFSVEADPAGDSAHGLRQLWHSTSRLASFASEPLIIEEATLEVVDVHDGTTCKVSNDSPESTSEVILAPNELLERHFTIDAQKMDLDDRRSAAINFQLEVRWRRQQAGSQAAKTTLPAPDLVIPFGEPRVLAAVGPPHGEAEAISVEYTIENPSTHVLTFDVSMETNDDFAFSGPKSTSLNLVPVSRRTIAYTIMPLGRGKWITPHFRVLDTHFNQVLRVFGTGGMRSDKKGASIWVDAEE